MRLDEPRSTAGLTSPPISTNSSVTTTRR
jgi:hypothetical protein